MASTQDPQLPATQEMEVEMVNSLAAFLFAVIYHPEAPVGKIKLAGQLNGYQVYITDEVAILWCNGRQVRDMFPGDNQDMDRGYRPDILKGYYPVVLVDYL